jgi:prevent-host-death family protein
MRQIGVRELKRSLSETLRAVHGGEQIRITVRGRAVADLVPAGASAGEERLRELVLAGRVSPPAMALPLAAPGLLRGSQSASTVVLSERDAER